MCKALLDTGRLRYLEAHGYRARLQRYVVETISPENVVLLAQRVRAQREHEPRS